MKEYVVIVLRNIDGRILFVKRSLEKKMLPGIWAFLSGTIEDGEEIFDNMKREEVEEIGYRLI